MAESSGSVLRVNGISADLAAGWLRDDASGGDIELRPQSLAVLRRLAQEPGAVVGKDTLIDAVWPNVAVTDDSLVQCIGDIRRALRDEAKTVLRTVPRRGYRLDLPAASPSPAPAKRRPTLLLAAAVAILALAGASWWRSERAPTKLPSIAVLPFDDMSADGDSGYLAAGVAEEIIGMLGRSPDIRVIARNSSFALGDDPVDMRQIGAALGVDYVLDGSLRRDGDRLRIGSELADARTGELVWSAAFDETGSDVQAIQGDLASRIVGSLAGERGAFRMELVRDAWARDETGLDEYAYYLRAVDLMHGAYTREINEQAARIAAEGLEAFPGSPLMTIVLAWTHWRAACNFWTDDLAADLAAAARLTREVVGRRDLTPRVALKAHWLDAFIALSEGNADGAREQVRQTLAISPYDPFVSAELSEVMIQIGDYDQALRLIAFAEGGDPAAADYHRLLRGWTYRLQGDFARSVAELRTVEGWGAWGIGQLAISLAAAGMSDAAQAEVRRMLAADPQMTQARWDQVSFYSDPKVRAAELARLAAAGLPE